MNDRAGETKPVYSVIVLLEEATDDFVDHVRTLQRIVESRGAPYELLIVANGLEGFLRQAIPRLSPGAGRLRAMALNKRSPQAVCLQAGFQHCRGEIIVVCGSYQQITEDSFGRLLDALQPGIDIISPWRQNRVDPSINQLQSRLFNFVTRRITGSDLHDLSCAVKVLRREVLEETQLYGNLYRFLPILAVRKGFQNREVACDHHCEHGPVGFFGFGIYFERLVDLLTLYFNTHFTRKPLRFFSTVGLSFFLLGLGGFGYVLLQKLFWSTPMGGRPVLLLSLLLVVIGVQCATVGLLGEIVAFTYGRRRKEFTIAEII